MNLKIKSTFYILGIVFLAACRDSKSNSSTDDKNDKAVKELVAKYNAVANWDTTLAYTSYYQRMFIELNKLMLFKGRVYDMIKEDSNYVVKVLDEREDGSHNFLAFITFTPEQLNATFTDDKTRSGIFIVKVVKITSSNPSIKEDEASDGDDRTYTYTHLSDDADLMLTIFKGKMVDCRIETLTDK